MSSADRRETEPLGTILVGVSAGIAAYKIGYAVRAFVRAGYDVHVLPTRESLNFVGASTWAELTGNHVATSVFDEGGPGHIELARRCDLFVVAPATANTIASLRAGIGNDMLTTTALATTAPMVVFPAMHTQMWLNPATQDNIATLTSRGIAVVPPVEGDLSSGDSGLGRLPEPEEIARLALEILRESQSRSSAEQPLAGRHVVITAGGNQEPIDPVRYIGNRSSGTQGIALADAALDLGATVTLIHGAVSVPLPKPSRQLRVVSAPTSAQMHDAVLGHLDDADALIMAAAVADFTPQEVQASKIKKNADTDNLVLHLGRTEDILKAVSTAANRPTVLVGFGAETGTNSEVLNLGRQKALAKGADLLAVNRVGHEVGFGEVDNTLTFFDAAGQVVGAASGTKSKIARDLMDRVTQLFREKTVD